jgi:hypothetical protein
MRLHLIKFNQCDLNRIIMMGRVYCGDGLTILKLLIGGRHDGDQVALPEGDSGVQGPDAEVTQDNI